MSDKPRSHRFFGDFVDSVAVAAGIAERVPGQPDGDEEQPETAAPSGAPAPPAYAPPSVPGSQVSQVSIPASASNTDAEVEQQFQAHYPDILNATPEPFRNFLGQRATLMESLRDSIAPDRLEAAAMKGALGVAHLTSQDVKAAMLAGRNSLHDLRGDFEGALANKRRERIEGPQKDIQTAQNQIASIEQQINQLRGQATQLSASIEPKKADITRAESDLARASSIFHSVCDKIDANLTTLESQLTPLTGGKTK